jgi:exodeoxyribonuclease VII large subunit
MVAEARRRLEADGLLDRPRRPIPRLPDMIGVVCGSDAAVRKDIESVVAVRFPGYPMRVVETVVSGPGAAISIMDALARLVAEPGVEVIVLARGGGDATQMLPFSDEDLCRALCDCPVPIVSAIGHDGDRPLCDEVADLRCGTPSLAAAVVVPDRAALLAGLAGMRAAAAAAVDHHLGVAERRLGAIDTHRAVQTGAGAAAARLDRQAYRLQMLHPHRQVLAARRQLAAIDRRGPATRLLSDRRARLAAVEWRRDVRDGVTKAAERLAADRRQLDALSPARVLDRGYAVVRGPHGLVVRRADQVTVGARVEVQLAAGRLGARVEESVND